VSSEYIVLRKEEYERMIGALRRAVKLAEEYAELALKLKRLEERVERKRKRGGRK